MGFNIFSTILGLEMIIESSGTHVKMYFFMTLPGAPNVEVVL
jgi:hypothetical protein